MGAPSITVYVDMKGTPHAFFELKDASGATEYYGFAPSRSGLPYTTKGRVGEGLGLHSEPDYENRKAGYMEDVAWKKEIILTEEQYALMNNKLSEWRANPPSYFLTPIGAENCTSFVKDILKSGNALYAGIRSGPLPESLIPINEMADFKARDPDTGREYYTDKATNPLNHPDTPAYQFKAKNPDLFPSSAIENDTYNAQYEILENESGSYFFKYTVSDLNDTLIQTDFVKGVNDGSFNETITGYDSNSTTFELDVSGQSNGMTTIKVKGDAPATAFNRALYEFDSKASGTIVGNDNIIHLKQDSTITLTPSQPHDNQLHSNIIIRDTTNPTVKNVQIQYTSSKNNYTLTATIDLSGTVSEDDVIKITSIDRINGSVPNLQGLSSDSVAQLVISLPALRADGQQIGTEFSELLLNTAAKISTGDLTTAPIILSPQIDTTTAVPSGETLFVPKSPETPLVTFKFDETIGKFVVSVWDATATQVTRQFKATHDGGASIGWTVEVGTGTSADGTYTNFDGNVLKVHVTPVGPQSTELKLLQSASL